MSWKKNIVLLFRQIEIYVDTYIILIGVYAIIPIAIAAIGPCNFKHILLLLILVSPPFLLSYIAKRLRLYNKKGVVEVILIVDVFLEFIYPIEIGAIVSLFYYKTLGLNGAAYAYFIGELSVLWIVQLLRITSTLFNNLIGPLIKLVRKILLKIKGSKTTVKIQGKSEPVVIKHIKYIVLSMMIITLILAMLDYLFVWSAICHYSN